MSFRAILSAASAAALFLACSSSKKLSQEESCQVRWEKLHKKFEKKKYNEIREQYSELVTSCPGSSFTEQAAFEVGEIQFSLGDWMEAESEYSSFLKDFPASRKFGEKARYKLAVAAAKQVGIPQRDQSKTTEAISDFEQFLDEYGDSPLADSARLQVDELTNKLAAKQLQIARLYSRMDEPQAAAIYYKNVLKDYGARVNQRDISLKLAVCYIELRQFDEAESYLAKFDGVAKDDPFKEQVKKAYAQLDKAKQKLAREKKEEQEQGKRQEAM